MSRLHIFDIIVLITHLPQLNVPSNGIKSEELAYGLGDIIDKVGIEHRNYHEDMQAWNQLKENYECAQVPEM